MGQESDALIAELIEKHAQIRPRYHKTTMADMGRDMGMPGLDRKLRNARNEGNLPQPDVIFGMWLRLDQYGKNQLLETLARDAGKEIPETSSVDLGERIQELLTSFADSLTEDQKDVLRGVIRLIGRSLR